MSRVNKSDKNQPQIDHFKCENLNYDLDKKKLARFVLEVLPNTVTQPRYIMVSIYQFILIIAVIKQKIIKFYEILQDFIARVI